MEQVPYELVKRVELDPYVSRPRFVMVLDTDALLSSIDNHCRTGRRPRLLRIAQSGSAPAYAEDHVYSETYLGFEKMADSSPVPSERLREYFEEHYLPLVRWVQTDDEGVAQADHRVALVTDLTDVPTAHLASLVAPCLVLSEDHSLRRPGFAPDQWRPAAGHGAVVVEADGRQQSAVMVAAIPPYALIGGGIKLGERAGVPWWLTLAIMAGGSYLLLRDEGRRASIGKWVVPMFEAVVQMMEEAEREGQAGAQQLREVLFQPGPVPSVTQQVATALARSPEPKLAKEVQETVLSWYGAEQTPTVSEIRAVLTESPEFTKPERYRWQLGRLGGPWRDE